MCRFDVLLDPIRATTVRAALDQTAADWIRQRQFDGAYPIPADVRSTEQIYAQALTRLAEVFLTADPEQRNAQFTAPVLYTAPLDAAESELAESVYGSLVPRSAITRTRQTRTRTCCTPRTASRCCSTVKKSTVNRPRGWRVRRQRTALAFRDRHCTYPGCNRPPTWSLHAHHRISYQQGGATAVKNLSLLCSEHHTLTHHRRAVSRGPGPKRSAKYPLEVGCSLRLACEAQPVVLPGVQPLPGFGPGSRVGLSAAGLRCSYQ